MAKLRQLQLQYHAGEDRLLLRANNDAGAEYRAWLTRKAVKLLWPKLLAGVCANPLIAGQANRDAQEAMLSFRHEEVVAKADFSTRYQERENPSYPLGEAPILAVRISLRPSSQGGQVLSLYPQQGQGIDLTLSEQLLHAFCKLMADTVGKADWGFALSLADGEKALSKQVVIH